MKFEILNDNEFDDFSKNNNTGSYVQTSDMRKIKEEQGYNTYIVGVKKSKHIIAATMMFSIKTFFNKKIFYAPRGFILDYNDISLLTFFTKEIKDFIKERNGIKLIIDPKVIYQLLDNNGNSINKKDDSIIKSLKTLGYKHFGFNKNFETIQVRYCSMLDLKADYNEMLKSFSKSTRKHIENLKNSGIQVRKGTHKDLEVMTNLLECSAINKNFQHRDLKYYELMFKYLRDKMNIYIAYINFEEQKKLIDFQLSDYLKQKEIIQKEMSKVNVGLKLTNKFNLIEKKIDECKSKIIENEDNHKKYGNKLDIAALLSVTSNDEYISLFSGMKKEFVNYNPKYALYDAHIKDAIKYGLNKVNFYGISGNLNNKNPLYGIFEIKKGFNGYIKELIGEFYLPINKWYYIYSIISKIKNK